MSAINERVSDEPMTHELKIYPEFFSAVATGVKRAELRKNDRAYRVGDKLHLMETPRGSCHSTGEYINATITHIADVNEWMPGYVLLSIERELQQYRAAAEKPVGSFHIIDQQVDGTTDYVKDGEWPIDNGELLVYAAPQVTSVARDAVRADHAQWSQATFGNVGPIGPLKHLSKEALEAAAAPEDLSEWADMQFLLWDAQRRAGISDEQIIQAMVEKLAVNKQREWPEPKDGEPRLHIAAPAVQAEPLSVDELANVLRNAPVAPSDNQGKKRGNSPAIPDGWTGSDKANAALVMLDRIDTLDPVDDDRIEGIKRIIRELASAPKQEAE